MTVREQINKVVKLALIDYQENPAFISFRLLSFGSKKTVLNRLSGAGYNAIAINIDGSCYIKINN